MRNRGPLEYDKWILNIMQIQNAINYHLKKINTENDFTEVINNLNQALNEMDELSERKYIEYLTLYNQ